MLASYALLMAVAIASWLAIPNEKSCEVKLAFADIALASPSKVDVLDVKNGSSDAFVVDGKIDTSLQKAS